MLLMNVRQFEQSFVDFPTLSVGYKNKEELVRSLQSIDYNSIYRLQDNKSAREVKLCLCGLSSLNYCA